MAARIADRTLKAFSLLLSYPTSELQRAMPAIRELVLSDRRIAGNAHRGLARLTDRIAENDIYDLEEHYVTLFDRTRSLSLNLFEHVHGESRDRGSAMVSLLETYRSEGFEPAVSELPDHLPVLLEFLSTRTNAEAKEMLADAAHILAALRERLEKRRSDFGSVFAALLNIANSRADSAAVAELMRRPDDDPDDLKSLDDAWEEAEVKFGPDPNAGCPQARELLSRMDLRSDSRRPVATK